MKQTIEIEVPDGKKAVWKDNKVVFEDIIPELPKTWVEFCNQNKIKKGEYSIDICGNIIEHGEGVDRNYFYDRNTLPSKQAAEAHLALIQLHQLRDCYRQGWEPDWNKYSYKFCIIKDIDTYKIANYHGIIRFLSFQSYEIAEEFLNNFRELIEEAGDLI